MRASTQVANRSSTTGRAAMTAPPALLGAALAAAGLALLGACPAEPTPHPAPVQRVSVRAFSEATAVHGLVSAPPFAFAATSDGLDRWDLRDGQRLHLSAEHGLPGSQVLAFDYDAVRRWLWIATETGLARYDLASATFSAVAPPPALLGLGSFAGATLAAARDGGVWLGLPRGLYYASREGHWAPTGVTAPVTALMNGGDGALWIGTELGLFRADPDGSAALFGRERGCDLLRIRLISQAPDGRALVVGDRLDGDQRVALADRTGCASYRPSPNRRWLAATPRGDELVVLTERRLYRLGAPAPRGRRIARDGLQLLPVPRQDGGEPAPSPYVLSPLDAAVPPGAQALAAQGSEVLVGTASLGTARLVSHGALTWLRSSELVEDATSLTVACAAVDDCVIAVGGRRAWHFDGQAFQPTGPPGLRILAVADTARGIVAAAVDERGQLGLHVRDGDGWRDLGLPIETPGSAPEVGFARVAPSGQLWLGLRYRDDAGELEPFGVAVVDLAAGRVAYHHASDDPDDRRRGILPVPVDVADVAFVGGAAWLASSEGAVRVRRGKVSVVGEAEGLPSAPLHAVACAPGGTVYVATGDGVLAFDGERWTAPRGLGGAVNDLAFGPDGRLWLATDRGVVSYDGARSRRLDARRGLLDDHIEDLAIDRFGRVWLRGATGIGLVDTAQ